MSIWGVIRLVIISTVGVVLLTYLTVDAPVR